MIFAPSFFLKLPWFTGARTTLQGIALDDVVPDVVTGMAVARIISGRLNSLELISSSSGRYFFA